MFADTLNFTPHNGFTVWATLIFICKNNLGWWNSRCSKKGPDENKKWKDTRDFWSKAERIPKKEACWVNVSICTVPTVRETNVLVVYYCYFDISQLILDLYAQVLLARSQSQVSTCSTFLRILAVPNKQGFCITPRSNTSNQFLKLLCTMPSACFYDDRYSMMMTVWHCHILFTSLLIKVLVFFNVFLFLFCHSCVKGACHTLLLNISFFSFQSQLYIRPRMINIFISLYLHVPQNRHFFIFNQSKHDHTTSLCALISISCINPNGWYWPLSNAGQLYSSRESLWVGKG